MKPLIAVIGAGNVGSHIISSAMLKNLSARFLLMDTNEEFEKSQILDLKDQRMFCKNTSVAGVSPQDPIFSETDIFVITAGAKQAPGENRCQLLGRNVSLLQKIKNNIGTIKSTALIIIVTNPVDILTECAVQIFGLPKSQVIGTGTLLDTARLRWRLAEKFQRNIHDVNGMVLGEHGDSEHVAWSTCLLADRLTETEKNEIEKAVKESAYRIIEGKGSTYFGIGVVTATLLQDILNDSKKILPLSASLTGEYSIEGISLGVPVKIGRNGIEEIYELPLLPQEKQKLHDSAHKLKTLFSECKSGL